MRLNLSTFIATLVLAHSAAASPVSSPAQSPQEAIKTHVQTNKLAKRGPVTVKLPAIILQSAVTGGLVYAAIHAMNKYALFGSEALQDEEEEEEEEKGEKEEGEEDKE